MNSNPLPFMLVICSINNNNDDSSVSLVAYSAYDIGGVESYVLNPWSAVVVDVFLDLALPLGRGRLIQWHLDGLVPVSHHYRPQGTVLSVHLLEMMGIRWKQQEFNRSRAYIPSHHR